MDTRRRISLLLLGSILISSVLAQPSSSSSQYEDEESSHNGADHSLDNNSGPDSSSNGGAQRRSGYFHSGLHYHLPSSAGFAYSAVAHHPRPYYAPLPVVKYPVIKPYLATTPLLHHHHAPARPHYHLHHGGASVSSYNVNYPRFPLYRQPVLKYPTIVKPTVLSSPAFVPSAFAPKPIIPIAINPVLPTAARPSVVLPQNVFNPSIFAGLNPQLVPISVSNGAVFTNYPTFAPTPLAPSAWKPIALPTVPTTFSVQRPSISILPPLAAPSSTIATLADPIHGHQHHHHLSHFQPQVPTTFASPLVNDVHDHHQHHHQLSTGQGNDLSQYYNQYNVHGGGAASGPSNSYVGPSSYEASDLHNAHQANEQSSLYHSDGGYQK